MELIIIMIIVIAIARSEKPKKELKKKKRRRRGLAGRFFGALLYSENQTLKNCVMREANFTEINLNNNIKEV